MASDDEEDAVGEDFDTDTDSEGPPLLEDIDDLGDADAMELEGADELFDPADVDYGEIADAADVDYAAIVIAATDPVGAATDTGGLEPEDPFNIFDQFLFRMSLMVPGMLHVLHNALKDVTKALQHFGRFKKMLKCVVKCFKCFALVEQFKEECLPNTDYADWETMFTLCPAFITWCWGSLIDSCRYL